MALYLYLALGAVGGAFARYWIGLWAAGLQRDVPAFPWGTLLINITGSLLLGFLMRWLTGVPASRELRIMLTTGFCGAYTTFSTFSYEAVSLLIDGQTAVAFTYMGASLVAAPLACYLGYVLAGLIL
jgi:CrcB protein